MKIAMATLFLGFATMVFAQQDKQESPSGHHCSMMKAESKSEDSTKHDEMMKHGDMAMGFSQAVTAHHFLLTASGGAIEVEANDPADTASREHIRHHLREIAGAFAEGDFSSPMLTHGKEPSGVPDMRRLKEALSYKFLETGRGGKVLISTNNPEALKAVHEFLLFQIHEHQTGDAETVQK